MQRLLEAGRLADWVVLVEDDVHVLAPISLHTLHADINGDNREVRLSDELTQVGGGQGGVTVGEAKEWEMAKERVKGGGGERVRWLELFVCMCGRHTVPPPALTPTQVIERVRGQPLPDRHYGGCGGSVFRGSFLRHLSRWALGRPLPGSGMVMGALRLPPCGSTRHLPPCPRSPCLPPVPACTQI